ncbi:H-NS histone family protein [Burkholderia sp. FERM BP-3421]|uniref:H-NS histone family protein n=1 Tax=Burkholderia sp. FERM BP-3421 TaxID=1494466 RepID=UPI00236120EE|nr:H-NS histone family protein [Burkholderia sp. FERM BP-3421]WDD96275.1 H-NS histone family protein [Burkholderia sp. FERM BP-3421]
MRREQASVVIAELRAAILEFGITPDDVFGARAKLVRRSTRGRAIQKYRDPLSGATWSGRGRVPRWIAGRNREDFLIAPGPSSRLAHCRYMPQRTQSAAARRYSDERVFGHSCVY